MKSRDGSGNAGSRSGFGSAADPGSSTFSTGGRHNAPRFTESEIKTRLDTALKSKQAPLLSQLVEGPYQDIQNATGQQRYPSQSEADQALCNILAFWLGRDPTAMDNVFRQSALMRPKWDEAHSADGLTYGQLTIRKATEDSTSTYGSPPRPDRRSARNGTIHGCTPADLKEQFSVEVNWIYRTHIPEGEPTMINGREGDGKTTFCLLVAKEILAANPDSMIYWFATEGAVRNTLAKLDELGLTSDRFQVAQKLDGSFLFDFSRSSADVDSMGELVRNAPRPVIAVFIDSLRGATSLDDNDSKVGTIMHHLNEIVCNQHKAALIYIHHFGKGKKKTLLDRSVGTTAAPAAVRHILSIVPAGKSKIKRLVKCSKSNIDDTIPDLEMVKQGNGFFISETGNEAGEAKIDRAERFLSDLFTDKKEIPSDEVFASGEGIELTKPVLKAAKQRLGIKSLKRRDRWCWVWP
jgi:NrS-1  polymerase HBD domain/AAA domain